MTLLMHHLCLQDKSDQEADPEAAEAVRTATTLLHQLRPADMQSNRYKVPILPPWSAMHSCWLLHACRTVMHNSSIGVVLTTIGAINSF